MLEGVSVTSLPEPENLPVLTYDEAHRQGAGAYIAELFDPDILPEGVFLGDNSRINTASLPCKSCQGIFWRPADQVVRRSSLEDSSGMINVGDLSHDGVLFPESNYTIFLRVMISSFLLAASSKSQLSILDNTESVLFKHSSEFSLPYSFLVT